MRSVNLHFGRALRDGLLAIAVCAWVAPVIVGGPLYLVPIGGVMKPARW